MFLVQCDSKMSMEKKFFIVSIIIIRQKEKKQQKKLKLLTNYIKQNIFKELSSQKGQKLLKKRKNKFIKTKKKVDFYLD